MFTPRQIAEKREESDDNIYESLIPSRLLATPQAYDTLSKATEGLDLVKMNIYDNPVSFTRGTVFFSFNYNISLTHTLGFTNFIISFFY